MSSNNNIIFALDIGTRNVVGVLGREVKGKLHITDTVSIEHDTRAMMDGQIHDISKVTKIIKQVKDKLEGIGQVELQDVAIAAAGRVLMTQVAEAVINFGKVKEITKSHIYTLQMQGVESAKQMLYDETRGETDYYCVAYTTICSFVDGYQIENIEGHKGREIKAKIIATFLPRQVIDSLYSSVEGAGLKASYLTLEPISAISIVIPPQIRMLNLALVDIGAGTSDIAITKEGTVTAYGMLPIAGDEFTEKIVDTLLVDFNTAEKIKKNLCSEKEVRYTDILGIEHDVKCSEVIDSLDGVCERLAEQICQKILDLNGNKAPKAVFCVGGGSQFPGLIGRIAEKLQIPYERVVVKDVTSTSEKLIVLDCELGNPEYITPVGICFTAWRSRKDSFIKVKVNGKEVQLLHTKKLKAIDAAIKLNYNSNNFIHQNGKDLEFLYNGKFRKVIGGLGTPAKVIVNGMEGGLMTPIKDGDEISLTPSKDGKDAEMTVSELIEDFKLKKIKFGEKQVEVKAVLKANGKNITEDYVIKNGDRISVKAVETLSDLIEYLNIDKSSFYFYVNNVEVTPTTPIDDGDVIELKLHKEENEEKPYDDFIVYVNGEEVKLTGRDSYMFIHLFNYIDFDINRKKGIIVLKLNGKPAKYTDMLNPNDKVEIRWQ